MSYYSDDDGLSDSDIGLTTGAGHYAAGRTDVEHSDGQVVLEAPLTQRAEAAATAAALREQETRGPAEMPPEVRGAMAQFRVFMTRTNARRRVRWALFGVVVLLILTCVVTASIALWEAGTGGWDDSVAYDDALYPECRDPASGCIARLVVSPDDPNKVRGVWAPPA